MDQTTTHHETDDRLDAQRDIIRQSLDAIVNDIGMAMRDVGLTFPLYITVRNSGDALVTIATPLDPSDADWQQASEIVCRTLEERVGCDRLRGRELACAIANAGADKCRRRDCRLRFNEFDINAGRLAVNSFRIPRPTGSPGAASLWSASARMCLAGGLTISK